MSVLIASRWPADTAKTSGVCPFSVSLTLMSAPASSSAVTDSTLPEAAARCSGADPLDVSAATGAPALTSDRTTAPLPERAARWSGVYRPRRVTAVRLAPA